MFLGMIMFILASIGETFVFHSGALDAVEDIRALIRRVCMA